MDKLFISGTRKGVVGKELIESVKKIFLEATDNLSWLRPGEIVLLKPALNSPDAYPATTCPLAVRAVAEAIIERKGRVIVGDQSGMEHVVLGPDEKKGSSRICFEKSGMADQLKEFEFIGFEEEGWDKGYYKFDSDKAKSWNDGFYVSNIVKRVDHIINLPRLSTHVQAGVTLGFKNFVGILRNDSRVEFHANGPFYSLMKFYFRGSKLLESGLNQKENFSKKITEISLAVEEKLRLTLLVATKAIISLGPDKGVPIFGFPSGIIEPENGLILASNNQVAIEAAAISFLAILQKENLSSRNAFFQKALLCLNSDIQDIREGDVWNNPLILHALDLGLGSKNFEIIWDAAPENLKENILNLLEK